MQRTVSAFFIGEKWALKIFDSGILNTVFKNKVYTHKKENNFTVCSPFSLNCRMIWPDLKLNLCKL